MMKGLRVELGDLRAIVLSRSVPFLHEVEDPYPGDVGRRCS
jgi:hypothetical protein